MHGRTYFHPIFGLLLLAVFFGLDYLLHDYPGFRPLGSDPGYDIHLDGTTIRLPDIQGFNGGANGDPILERFLNKCTPAPNILLRGYISDADMARLRTRSPEDTDTFFLVLADGNMNGTPFGGNRFPDYQRQGLAATSGIPLEELPPTRDVMDSAKREISRTFVKNVDFSTLDIAKLIPFIDSQYRFSLFRILRVNASDDDDPGPRYYIATYSFLLASNRILSVNLYKRYRAREDLDEALALSRQITRRIVDDNKSTSHGLTPRQSFMAKIMNYTLWILIVGLIENWEDIKAWLVRRWRTFSPAGPPGPGPGDSDHHDPA